MQWVGRLIDILDGGRKKMIDYKQLRLNCHHHHHHHWLSTTFVHHKVKSSSHFSLLLLLRIFRLLAPCLNHKEEHSLLFRTRVHGTPHYDHTTVSTVWHIIIALVLETNTSLLTPREANETPWQCCLGCGWRNCTETSFQYTHTHTRELRWYVCMHVGMYVTSSL